MINLFDDETYADMVDEVECMNELILW